MFMLIFNLLFVIPILSFLVAGIYWFFAGAIFQIPIPLFVIILRNTYLVCVVVWLVFLVLNPAVEYCVAVRREWDSNLHYLKWAKEHQKDPGDW